VKRVRARRGKSVFKANAVNEVVSERDRARRREAETFSSRFVVEQTTGGRVCIERERERRRRMLS